jgi:hypothetical protein
LEGMGTIRKDHLKIFYDNRKRRPLGYFINKTVKTLS